MNIQSVISGLSVVVFLGLSTAVHAQNNTALTWKNKTPPQLTGAAGKIGNQPNIQRIVVVGCTGCDAYKGDTNINKERRILCIVPGNQPEPAVYAALIAANNPFKKFYYNWSGGKIGLTKPIQGTRITSRAVGDRICRSGNEGLNDNKARMLEHHDNRVGGWNVGGFIHPNSKAKEQLRKPKKTRNYWVRIRNQALANPWH